MGLRRVVVAGGLAACLLGLGTLTRWSPAADDAPAASAGREIPPAFAPFEYLIGSWKGAGVPQANKLRGWEEKHAWAWKFEKGAPVGLSVTMTGDKVLSKGQLAFDAASKQYVLTGTDPAGKPVRFAGTLQKRGKSDSLSLDRQGTAPDGAKQRIVLYPNANLVRYTLEVDEQEPGAPRLKPAIQAGLTKEGEAFASGSSAADLPKCVITGGAATMSVTYQGASYPLCCTGCRDEFNENPEKYIKKAKMLAGSKPSAKPAASRTNKDDGSFDGLVDTPAPKKPAATSKAKARTSGASKEAGDTPAPALDAKSEPARGADVSRAASTLRLGQNLEKAGKTAAALGYYRRVVKDYPNTPSAKTAAERIKALGGE